MKVSNKINLLRSIALGASALALTAGTALAQVNIPSAQTGGASAGRVEEQIKPRQLMPREVPQVEVQQAPAPEAPAGAAGIKFRLDNLQISDATVYTPDELQTVYADKLGQTISLADLYGIAAELTRKYRNDGYILTQVVVPPQEIEGGSARLRVVEGFIDEIIVEGSDNNDQTLNLMRDYSSRIKVGQQALNIRDLERALLLINDLPGVSARSVLSPSPDMVGAADLRILVTRDPWEGLVAIDNHGTKYLGPVQAMAAVSLNSMLNLNERITAQFVLAPGEDFKREMEYIALSYEMPLGTYGTELTTTASYSFTKPGYDLEQFNVQGKSAYWGITVSHPFVRTRNSNFTARATYDMRNVDSTNDFERKREDNIRAVRLGGKFEYLDNIFGLGFNVLDMELSQGLTIMGSSNTGDFMSRAGAEPDFVKLTAEYQRLQRLFPQVNLLLGTKGQWANDALYSSEEFGLGGQSYGRGFDPSEIIGDSGFAGKAEVQWNDPVKFDGVVKTYQLYSFVDAGRVFNTDPGANALRTDTLFSVGVGARFELGTGTQAGVMMAKPLNRDVATMKDEDPRFYVNLNHRF